MVELYRVMCFFQLSEYNSWGVQELVLLLQVDPQNVVVDVVRDEAKPANMSHYPVSLRNTKLF